jgi:hypothetical protein
MRFSLSYVKSNPVLFGGIVVVFGLMFWLLMNKGAAGSSAPTYVSSGPSEALQVAQLQAGTQVQLAGISAQSANAQGAMQLEALSRQIEGQIGMAQLEAQYQTLALGVESQLSKLQIDASLAALNSQMANNLAITEENNSFQIGYAKVAYDAAEAQAFMGAALQRDLAVMQADAYKQSNLLAILPSLKKRDRAAFAANVAASAQTYPQIGNG